MNFATYWQAYLTTSFITSIVDHISNFSDHMSNICKTADQKLNPLFRGSANMNSD